MNQDFITGATGLAGSLGSSFVALAVQTEQLPIDGIVNAIVQIAIAVATIFKLLKSKKDGKN